MESKTFLTMLILTLILTSVFAVFPFGQAQSGSNVDGIITQNTVWTQTGSPYMLTGNVLVNNGLTLTINAGTVVNLGSYYIMVKGTLIAEGTSSNPVTFNGGAITFTTSSLGWNEQTASGCIIQNANFKNSTGATIIASSIKVTNTNGAYFNIQDSSPTISNNNKCGIEVYGGSAIISNNNIDSSITVEYGSPIITNNTITKGQIVLKGGNSFVNNNVILFPTFFSIEQGAPTIEGNFITATLETGPNANPTIEKNTFAGTHDGITTGKGNVQMTLKYNNFQNVTKYSIYWAASNSLDASNNWWGTTDQSAIRNSIYDHNKDFTLGQVTFTPFLTAPNLQAQSSNTPIPTSNPTPVTPEFPSIALLFILILAATVPIMLYCKKRAA